MVMLKPSSQSWIPINASVNSRNGERKTERQKDIEKERERTSREREREREREIERERESAAVASILAPIKFVADLCNMPQEHF